MIHLCIHDFHFNFLLLCLVKLTDLKIKHKIMFQIFFVPKYFWVLEAVIFGTLLPDHPVDPSEFMLNSSLTLNIYNLL